MQPLTPEPVSLGSGDQRLLLGRQHIFFRVHIAALHIGHCQRGTQKGVVSNGGQGFGGIYLRRAGAVQAAQAAGTVQVQLITGKENIAGHQHIFGKRIAIYYHSLQAFGSCTLCQLRRCVIRYIVRNKTTTGIGMDIHPVDQIQTAIRGILQHLHRSIQHCCICSIERQALCISIVEVWQLPLVGHTDKSFIHSAYCFLLYSS